MKRGIDELSWLSGPFRLSVVTGTAAHRYRSCTGPRIADATALRAEPVTSVPMAMPRTRLSPAVATLDAVLWLVVNGQSIVATVASDITHPKKRIGRGVDTSSRCIRPVAAKLATTAAKAYHPVLASPH